jgi:hypothetical protein
VDLAVSVHDDKLAVTGSLGAVSVAGTVVSTSETGFDTHY